MRRLRSNQGRPLVFVSSILECRGHMKVRLYQSTVLVLLCTTLGAGCSDQLSGGIVGDDGDLGLGASAVKAEKEAEESSKNSNDSDIDDSDNDDSKNDDSEKDGSDKDSSGNDASQENTETSGSEQSETGASNDDSETGDEGSDSSSSTEDENTDDTNETVSQKVKVSFTTKTYEGDYGPRHVGAAWIEAKDGTFVRTIRQWGEIRERHLVKWKAVSNSNVVDAVTGATLFEHETHSLTWNLRDKDGNVVPEGEYVLGLEFTEENSSFDAEDGPSLRVPFTLGGGSETLTPADNSAYVDVEVVVPF